MAMKTLGMKGVICVPNDVSSSKDQTLKLLNANLVYHGQDCVETEIEARRVAEARQNNIACTKLSESSRSPIQKHLMA